MRISDWSSDVCSSDLEQMDRLMPTDRIVSDTSKVVYYYRPSPDRSRIVFGGRVTSGETDPRHSGTLLRRDMVKLFPKLASVRIRHSWSGLAAYTYDTRAHLGSTEAGHTHTGYCRAGGS